MKKIILSFALSSLALAAAAEFRFNNLFSDHAVLQRGQRVPVWGTGAKPGELVSLTLGARKAWTRANAEGMFRTYFAPMPAGGPYELVATDATGAKAVAKDVYVGEVWLGSGQSNMEFPMKKAVPGFGDVDRPLVRVFSVKNNSGEGARREAEGQWTPALVGKTDMFSAVATFFAMRLSRELGCAVGMLTADWGGTHIEAWMSRRALRTTKAGRDELDELDDGFSDARKWGDDEARGNAFLPLDDGPGDQIAWAAKDFDETGWMDVRVPAFFDAQYGRFFNGAVWYRKTVELPADWAGKDLVLDIPCVDKMDITWFDGVEIGRTGKGYELEWCEKPRHYPVPARLVKGGKATVAIRVWSQVFAGGICGEGTNFVLRCADGKGSVCLAGAWKSKIGRDAGVPREGFYLPVTGRPNCPAGLYDAMIAPLIPYAIKGVIWYQGESNGSYADHCLNYGEYARAMITDWRAAWGQGDFAFCFVELASFGPRGEKFTGRNPWSEIRASMLETTRTIPNCGIASALDLFRPERPTDIHPTDKLSVGNRLAQWALATQYGRKDLVACGPRFSHAETVEGKLICHFTEVGSGLVAKGSADGSVTWCHIAGGDGEFLPAEAKIVGDTLVLSSPKVPRPLHVRYAWAQNPEGANLFNKEGLPASAFRW